MQEYKRGSVVKGGMPFLRVGEADYLKISMIGEIF